MVASKRKAADLANALLVSFDDTRWTDSRAEYLLDSIVEIKDKGDTYFIDKSPTKVGWKLIRPWFYELSGCNFAPTAHPAKYSKMKSLYSEYLSLTDHHLSGWGNTSNGELSTTKDVMESFLLKSPQYSKFKQDSADGTSFFQAPLLFEKLNTFLNGRVASGRYIFLPPVIASVNRVAGGVDNVGTGTGAVEGDRAADNTVVVPASDNLNSVSGSGTTTTTSVVGPTTVASGVDTHGRKNKKAKVVKVDPIQTLANHVGSLVGFGDSNVQAKLLEQQRLSEQWAARNSEVFADAQFNARRLVSYLFKANLIDSPTKLKYLSLLNKNNALIYELAKYEKDEVGLLTAVDRLEELCAEEESAETQSSSSAAASQ